MDRVLRHRHAFFSAMVVGVTVFGCGIAACGDKPKPTSEAATLPTSGSLAPPTSQPLTTPTSQPLTPDANALGPALSGMVASSEAAARSTALAGWTPYVEERVW